MASYTSASGDSRPNLIIVHIVNDKNSWNLAWRETKKFTILNALDHLTKAVFREQIGKICISFVNSVRKTTEREEEFALAVLIYCQQIGFYCQLFRRIWAASFTFWIWYCLGSSELWNIWSHLGYAQPSDWRLSKKTARWFGALNDRQETTIVRQRCELIERNSGKADYHQNISFFTFETALQNRSKSNRGESAQDLDRNSSMQKIPGKARDWTQMAKIHRAERPPGWSSRWTFNSMECWDHGL
jgi:hypothetical protein